MNAAMNEYSENDAKKEALQALIEAMYNGMDFGEDPEAEMEPGEISDAMDEMGNEQSSEEMNDPETKYNPIEAGDAEGVEPESDENGVKDMISNFFKSGKSPSSGKKSMTAISISKKPAKKAKRKRKMEY